MLETVTDLYKAFLDGIKKESTSIVIPSKFNRIINEAQLIWLRDNVKTVELNQKQIDDLRVLRVVPEGISPTATGSNIFPLPDKYYRLLNVQFAFDVGDEAGSELAYKTSHVMRSDQRTSNKESVYREPTSKRLYHDLIGDNIYFYGGDGVIALSAKPEYLRKAIDIEYIPGKEGTNCELPEAQRQEVVDIAVRIHLERIKNPRYKSFTQEEAIKSQSK